MRYISNKTSIQYNKNDNVNKIEIMNSAPDHVEVTDILYPKPLSYLIKLHVTKAVFTITGSNLH